MKDSEINENQRYADRSIEFDRQAKERQTDRQMNKKKDIIHPQYYLKHSKESEEITISSSIPIIITTNFNCLEFRHRQK